MVRNPARPRPAETLAAPARAIVRDFSRSGAEPYEVLFDVRTLYDFVFSLSDEAGSTDDLPAPDRAWLDEAKTTLRARTGTALELYGIELCVVLAGLGVDRPEVRDAASLVALLYELDDAAIARTVVSDDLRDPDRRQLTEQALAGDESAIDVLVSSLSDSHSPDKVARLRTIYRDPTSIVGPAR